MNDTNKIKCNNKTNYSNTNKICSFKLISNQFALMQIYAICNVNKTLLEESY